MNPWPEGTPPPPEYAVPALVSRTPTAPSTPPSPEQGFSRQSTKSSAGSGSSGNSLRRIVSPSSLLKKFIPGIRKPEDGEGTHVVTRPGGGSREELGSAPHSSSSIYHHHARNQSSHSVVEVQSYVFSPQLQRQAQGQGRGRSNIPTIFEEDNREERLRKAGRVRVEQHEGYRPPRIDPNVYARGLAAARPKNDGTPF
ncbi:hypothetical protein JCM3765_000752 [Sporobolomyces pararoseus]